MLATLDVVIIGLYAVLLIGLATWFSREPAGHEKTTQDYFLASRSLPWWAVGASLVAANISAEQIIGMSGSGYAIGLAIASYEWMAAITLILVGKFLLPVFLKHNIQTMPQFLEQRFDSRVRLVLALFWLAVYVFVNLTAILWLGALTIHTVTGIGPEYGARFDWGLCTFVLLVWWTKSGCVYRPASGGAFGCRWAAHLVDLARSRLRWAQGLGKGLSSCLMPRLKNST